MSNKGAVPVTVFWTEREAVADELKEGWILIHPELLKCNEEDGVDVIDVVIAFIEKKYECTVDKYFGSREAATSGGYELTRINGKEYISRRVRTELGADKHANHTTDRSDPDLHVESQSGQNKKYLILSEEERAKGFVRPVRQDYVHEVSYVKDVEGSDTLVKARGCGVRTTMSLAIAETYARDPKFYGSTWCTGCRKHLPLNEFVWDGTKEEVGS